jgi:hypothetical protein
VASDGVSDRRRNPISVDNVFIGVSIARERGMFTAGRPRHDFWLWHNAKKAPDLSVGAFF